MKTALLIMAAGIGSRYGGGIKQLATVDTCGHIIMDYSIHDAIKAGFSKIIFVIRRDIEKDFKEVIGERMERICQQHGVEVCYAFQSMEDLPDGFSVPVGRTKPWGTGQAVLSAKEYIKEPFVVINADDYYGANCYKILRDYLIKHHGETQFCMAGFILKNTLSKTGGVTRGICQVNENLYLTDIVETPNIKMSVNEDGKIEAYTENGVLNPDSHVSMNMWGLTPAFVNLLEDGFVSFMKTAVPQNPLKAEYLLPILIGQLLKEEKVSVQVLETCDKWFGVTYQEDRAEVERSFGELIANGVYQENLFDDL